MLTYINLLFKELFFNYDRTKYMPWQGGKYGGFIEFEAFNKKYRLTRFFGKTPEFDSLEILDLTTNQTLERPNEEIGDILFKVGKESFEVTAFFPQLKFASTTNAQITANLTGVDKFQNDLSNFNTELENNGLKFTRAFGLVEFKFTLPQEEANAVGTFSCDNFRLTARIYNQIDKNGWFSTDGDSKTKFKVDNLKVGTDGTLTFYSLVPKINLKNNPEGSGNFPDVKYVFTIGDKTYTKTINYGRRVDIYPNKATKIAVDFTDQSAQ